MKKWGKVLGILIILIGIVIISLITIRYIRIQKVKETIQITAPNGIEEEVVIEINGIRQYLNIRGNDMNNPIIVMIHGGAPMTPVIHTYQPLWEKEYTVVNFDRRACGETYFLNQDQYGEMLESMTPERYIEDIKEIVAYVQSRFNKEKVIIMADSFGTSIGSRFVLEYPEMVEAYIGSAQIVNTQDDYMKCQKEILEKAKAAGDEKAVQELERIESMSYDLEGMLKINEILSKYIGKYISKEALGSTTEMVMAGLESPYFPISHLSYYMKMGELQKADTEYIYQFNLYDYGNEFKVPVIFIYGSEDWITRYTIEAYYNEVQAPYKQLVCIPNVGHDTIQVDQKRFYESFNQALNNAF